MLYVLKVYYYYYYYYFFYSRHHGAILPNLSISSSDFLLTLYNNLVARHQYLLSIRCLGILKDSSALLASTRVGHGDSLQTLNALRPWSC